MSDIIVNRVALACDLADHILRREWASLNNKEEDLFEQDPENPEGTIYTLDAQNIFEEYYGDFMTIIERNEFPGQIRK